MAFNGVIEASKRMIIASAAVVCLGTAMPGGLDLESDLWKPISNTNAAGDSNAANAPDAQKSGDSNAANSPNAQNPQDLKGRNSTIAQGIYAGPVNLSGMTPGQAEQAITEYLNSVGDAGVTMTGPGATHPYHKDPKDSVLRIAPSFPPVEELQKAMEVFCVAVRLAAVEKLLA